MKAETILEELRRVKDQLAAEAGYHVDRFLENLRRWEAECPASERVVHSAEELRQLVAEEERKRAGGEALALKEEPPRRE
jgi:hypothetical protein